jgi:prepilin signal peptidase PulO-like enzyme (type II secretory pathway)
MPISPFLDATVSLAQWWVTGSLTVLGACIGSFLNVVIYRVPAGLSLVSPPSRCPQCRTPILAFDNVPILSWLILRGRCRACEAWIPIRYPLVELFTAAVFTRIGWTFSVSANGFEADLFDSLWQCLAKSGWPLLVALIGASCLIVVACWCVDRVSPTRGFMSVVTVLVIAATGVSSDWMRRLAAVSLGAVAGLIVGGIGDLRQPRIGNPLANRPARFLPNTIAVGVLASTLNDGWENTYLLLGGSVTALVYALVIRTMKYPTRHHPMTIWAVSITVASGLRASPWQTAGASHRSFEIVALALIAVLSLLTCALVPRQSLDQSSDA